MQRLVGDVVRHVDPERFESHVMGLPHLGHFADSLHMVAKVHQAVPLPKYSMLWPGPLIKQIRAIAPDVLHAHSGVWYKASLAARRAGVPRVVYTDHGRWSPDPWSHRLLDGLASRRTDVVIAVSEALGRQMTDTVVADASRLRVVRNGVDTDVHTPRTDTGRVREELGLSSTVPIIGSIGRLEPVKRYDLMVRALAALRAEWESGELPVLVLAGDGSERARVDELAAELHASGAVRLIGWRDDVQDLHSAFTVFSMSSESEGTSLSLLEAMSAGVCPVVTDVGGNAAVLGDELRHRLVPPNDVAALAAGWRRALEDADRRRQDAGAGRDRVIRHFALRSLIAEYEHIYLGEA
jgi:glycosyltransferase involved in cell wall biosynthesis